LIEDHGGRRGGNADCHWRNAQQKRRRRWSRRGLATLASCFAIVAVGAFALVWGPETPPETDEKIVAVAQDSVAGDPLANPPRHLFERPPVTERILSLDTAANELGAERFVESMPILRGTAGGIESLEIRYTLDTELTRKVFKILHDGRVALGHVILLDPDTGRVLTYASTDVARFPPNKIYPAASLVKIITAAAALDLDPGLAKIPCRYSGSPYKLTRKSIDPPRSGHEVSLRKALASSNNQCFAQLAVHAVGEAPLVDAISRFGWLSEPAPNHPAGSVDPGEDRYDVGRLGCGLAGSWITPLHAAQLAATLARGELVAPHWIEGVHTADGREMLLPANSAPRQVMTPELADELRAMLTDTTVKGTARSAFRKRNGTPMLGPVKVAGKTGSLSGTDPEGRYEWFAGVAPADKPEIAVAVLLVQSPRWWRSASQIAAEVLQSVFCEGRNCSPELAARWVSTQTATAAASNAKRRSVN
jgi:cell division protein FtsI/penicillin-binding protein 2